MTSYKTSKQTHVNNVECFTFPQITTYLGKRDFVDHTDHIDPIGEF